MVSSLRCEFAVFRRAQTRRKHTAQTLPDTLSLTTSQRSAACRVRKSQARARAFALFSECTMSPSSSRRSSRRIMNVRSLEMLVSVEHVSFYDRTQAEG
jgi:hypothetical protein